MTALVLAALLCCITLQASKHFVQRTVINTLIPTHRLLQVLSFFKPKKPHYFDGANSPVHFDNDVKNGQYPHKHLLG